MKESSDKNVSGQAYNRSPNWSLQYEDNDQGNYHDESWIDWLEGAFTVLREVLPESSILVFMSCFSPPKQTTLFLCAEP